MNGDEVITNNGKPAAILIDISDGSFEEMLKAIHQAKAMMTFNSVRTGGYTPHPYCFLTRIGVPIN